MAISTQIIEDWERLAALAPEWGALLARSRADSIFLTWEWIDAWRRALGAERLHPFAVAARDESGALVGIAPLHATSMRLGGIVPYRTLQTLGDRWSAAEYPDWIALPEREDEVMAAMARALADSPDPWSCIWMPVVSGWTGARERIGKAAAAAGLQINERPVEFSAVALPETFEAYVQSLSQNARSVLRRRRKQILQGGDIAFTVCERPEEVPGYLEALFDLNRKRWNAEGLEGTFHRKPLEAEFYRRFAPSALEKGWLRIFALRRRGEFLALQIGYARGGSFLQLQEGFDPAGPDGLGNALRGLAIERLIQEGVRTYDFLGEYGDHKRRWLAEPRAGYDLLIGRKTLKARLLLSAQVWPTGRYLRPEAEAMSSAAAG